jgi:hypothetical protein
MRTLRRVSGLGFLTTCITLPACSTPSSRDEATARVSLEANVSVVGAEVVASSPVVRDAPLTEVVTNPKIAGDGQGTSLVVWSVNGDILGMRVANQINTNGVLLDPFVFPIASAAGDSSLPDVAFDGTNWLVVWSDSRGGNADIRGARVSRAGAVLDPDGFAISTATNQQTRPLVHHDGSDWFVAWADQRSGSITPDVFGARVTAAGTTLDTDGILVARPGTPTSVSHDETNWLIVFDRGTGGTSTGVFGARVGRDGTLRDATGVRLSPATGSQTSGVASFDGTDWFVAWRDGTTIHGSKYTEHLAPFVASPLVLSAATARDSLAVAHNGSYWLVTWRDFLPVGATHIMYAGVTPSGEPSSQRPLATAPVMSTGIPSLGSPAVAHDGTSFFAVWPQDTDSKNAYVTSGDNVYGMRIDDRGIARAAESLLVSRTAAPQSSPAADYDGTNWLVVWREVRSGTAGDLFGVRVNGSGQVLDANPIAIATTSADEATPAVEFDGSAWIVAWSVPNGVSGTEYRFLRVTSAGTLASTSRTVAFTSFSRSIALSHDQTRGLAAYISNTFPNQPRAFVRQLNANGSTELPIELPPRALPESPGIPARARLAYDGTNYLVVWDVQGTASDYGVYAARVSAAGTVLDASAIAIARAVALPQGGVSSAFAPAVSHDGTNWLVSFRRGNATRGFATETTRVSANGTVLDATPSVLGPVVPRAPELQFERSDLAHDGTSFLGAWSGFGDVTGEHDIQGTRVDAEGSPIAPLATPLSAPERRNSAPALAPGANGKLLVAYESALGSERRVRFRVVTSTCVIDTDGDAVPDCRDECPTEPASTPEGCAPGGTGGSGGMGGSAGTAGAPGTGGTTAGSGGEPGTAGTTAGTSGAAGGVGGSPTPGGGGGTAGSSQAGDGSHRHELDIDADVSCSCKVPGAPAKQDTGSLAGLAALALGFLRRRLGQPSVRRERP